MHLGGKRRCVDLRLVIFQKNVADFHREDPFANCLLGGPSEILNSMYRIIQSPNVAIAQLNHPHICQPYDIGPN